LFVFFEKQNIANTIIIVQQQCCVLGVCYFDFIVSYFKFKKTNNSQHVTYYITSENKYLCINTVNKSECTKHVVMCIE